MEPVNGLVLILWQTFYFASAAAPASIATEIRFLLDEQAGLRQKLESRMQDLKQRAASLNNAITPCNCTTSPTAPPKRQVAFTGTLPTAVSGVSTSTIFHFNGDVVNEGQPYEFQYDRFTAPVSGLYAFSLATYMPQGTYIYMDVVQDAQSIMHVKHGHYYSSRYNRQINMGTNFVLVNITKGTEVWPRYVGGSGQLSGDGVPTFSGALLNEF